MVNSNVPANPGVAIGQRVRVPWGLDRLEGVVVDVYGGRAVIRVSVPGAEGDGDPQTVVFPIAMIESIGSDARPLGTWLKAVRTRRRSIR